MKFHLFVQLSMFLFAMPQSVFAQGSQTQGTCDPCGREYNADGLAMVLLIALFVGLFFLNTWFMKVDKRRRAAQKKAIQVHRENLKERFVKGEIDQQEYDKKLRKLDRWEELVDEPIDFYVG